MKYILLALFAVLSIGCEKAAVEVPKNTVQNAPISPQKKSAAIETRDGFVQLLESKAMDGDLGAQLVLAAYYSQDWYVEEKEKVIIAEKAFKLITKAAETGDPAAQYMLGGFYMSGFGVIKNDLLASQWFSKSADQNYAEAENTLCVMYNSGIGVDENYKVAIDYCQRAIKHGYPKQYSNLDVIRLGRKAINTTNPMDIDRQFDAIKDRNSGLGMDLLEGRYGSYSRKFGRSVSPGTQAALKWYERASVAGNAYAQRELANMYFNSDGIESNYPLAYAWALVAKQSPEYKDSFELDFNIRHSNHELTTKEKNEGQALASGWSIGKEMVRKQ